MKLIYLKEGRHYTAQGLAAYVHDCLKEKDSKEKDSGAEVVSNDDLNEYDDGFFKRLPESINKEFDKSVVKGKNGVFFFHYVGLYDYVDEETGKNLTFFFLPKFLDVQDDDEIGDDEQEGDTKIWEPDKKNREGKTNIDVWKACCEKFEKSGREILIQAIDRYSKADVKIVDQTEAAEEKPKGILELAVRFLRDYLEKGLYIVQRHELELNGQGEIDWQTTIDEFQPVIKNGRPYYMDVKTEQAYSDEEHYITRLQKCLVTTWGRKLEGLGLSSVLRVNVPLLSEEELDQLGDDDSKIAQINRELNVQFVTKSRETLSLMKALILRSAENKVANYESLSFGMTGAHALWERACAEVLGTELDQEICKCGFNDFPQGVTFSEYMPRVFWQNLVPDENGKNDAKALNSDKGFQRSKKAGWRLDFIRTWRPNGRVEKLVILDAKYYCTTWKNRTINGQPGTPDIAKQMFYQMAFLNLVHDKNIGMVNAFLLPEDDKNPKYNLGDRVKKTETVRLESREKGRDKFEETLAFKDIKLFTVRIPGIRLLERYANWEIADDWFESIVKAAPNGEDGVARGSDTPDAPEKKDGNADEPAREPTVEGNAQNEVSTTTGLGEEKSENTVATSGDSSIVILKNNGEPVSPIVDDGLSKEFIRDVMSIPSCSGREEMMKEYIKQFATARRIEVKEDAKGNLYLTKGKTTNEKGYYPCLVNHMDTEQEKHLPYIKDHKRLKILERKNGDGQTEFYVQGMGIGADDKSGCAIALALLDKLPIAKAAFFVEEERGMVGSKALDREWFRDVGFCLSFDSPERNRSARTCENARTHQKEKLYEDWFFQEILKPICDVHGITVFKDEPPTDIVQIRQKTPIMCYNVGNGGSYPPHALSEFLVVEDTQAAYKFGFDLLREIGENRYWFGDDGADAPREDGGGTPRDPDPPETPDSVNPAEADGSGSVSSSASDVCNCRMESAATKSGLAQLDGPCKVKGLDGAIADDVFTDTMRLQTKERQIMPGLKIYHGSRIEDLAEKLAEELKAERAAKGPFDFLKVAVANPNLGNWLKMKVLAKVPELGAGIVFPFAEALMVEVLLENVPQGVILELKQEHDYAIAIMDILLCDKRKEFSLFRRYITDGSDTLPLPDSGLTQRQARKAWQLSYRLAQMIDDYESYGSIALLSEVSGKTEAYTAEKTLADILLGPGGRMAAAGKASLRDLFERVRTSPPSGPASKLRLFGFSFLTPLMVEILAWIAKTHEVEVYCPHPFGLKETKLPELHACEARFEADLKKACGGMGVILGEEEVVADREKPSHVLVQVQDVLSGAAQGFKSKQDASVQIVGAPGIRREVELVYNAILGAVWEKNENGKPVRKTGMSFSDFAVIVPDMKAYRPMIEAVFEGLGQIPYGLIDVTSEDYCSYLGGFLALVELGRRGLSRRRLFDVLENPCVQRALAFGQDEVVKWRSIVDKIGAYDGYAKNESPSGYFNWEWALNRLRLGLVSDKIQVVNENGLKSGTDLPLEPYDKDEATRFSEVVEMLFRKTAALKDFHVKCYAPDEHWCASWAGRLHDIMDNFLAVDPENALDVRMRSRIVKTLNELGPVEGAWNFELAAAAVEHAVSGSLCAKGGCIRSGVTIGGFRSLAYVPFKWIFVLGMGEGVFPHRDSISTLDVRSAWSDKDWKGLRSSDEDRARFLAAVLSARERLVITYQNRNIMDDAESYSSPLVRDVEVLMSKDVLDEQFVEMEGFPLVESECLDVAMEEKFAGLRKSFSRTAWALAGRLVAEKKETSRKDGSEHTGENTATDTTEKETPSLAPLRFDPKVLAEFVKEPFKAILERKLGIAKEGYRDGTIDDESPLGMRDRTIEWELQKQLVIDAVENGRGGGSENAESEGNAAPRNFEDAVAEIQQKGMLPSDFLGKYAVEKLSALKQDLSALVAQHVITLDDEKALTEPQNKKNGKVLCRRFSVGSAKSPITIPPDAVLEPLIAELRQMVVSCVATDDKDKQHEISVKLINVADGVVGEGKWMVSAKEADVYLRNVCDHYEKFLSKKGKDGYPSIKYESFRKAKKSIKNGEAICYSDLAKVVSDKKDDGHWGQRSFDSSVVVDELVKDFKRDPDAEQLRDLYENLFRLPMEGSFSVASVEKEEQK